MFEKEAEEYAIEHEYEYDDIEVAREALYQGYFVGAEFGYNKANEWHDLRKNPDDLPKHRRGIDKMTDDLYYRKLESTSTSDLVDMLREKDRRIAELEEENAELKELIEKMKCCENCKYHSFWGDELKCNLPSYDEQFNCLDSKDKWELID